MYRIVECSNAYHAHKHYQYGQKVLSYDLATPVKWVIESGFRKLKEAKDALMKLAMSCRDYESGEWTYIDEDYVHELSAELKEDFPNEEPDMSWFKGPGIYAYGDGYGPVLLEGGTGFTDDTETFIIEEEG